jgi:hypothetical protein
MWPADQLRNKAVGVGQSPYSCSYPVGDVLPANSTLLIMRDEPGVAEDLNIRDSAIADVRIVYHSRTTRVSTPKIEQAIVNAAMISMGAFPRARLGVGKDARRGEHAQGNPTRPHTPALCVCV